MREAQTSASSACSWGRSGADENHAVRRGAVFLRRKFPASGICGIEFGTKFALAARRLARRKWVGRDRNLVRREDGAFGRICATRVPPMRYWWRAEFFAPDPGGAPDRARVAGRFVARRRPPGAGDAWEEVLKNCLLTINLTDENLFEKLEVICKVLDADYKLIDGQVIIYGKGC